MVISPFLYSQTDEQLTKIELAYSTFLGGSGNDATWWLDNMAIDDSSNLCLAIDTDSEDFPVTENAYDKTFNGGNKWGMEDIAIVKFSIKNNRPEYVSYFGGSGPEFVTQVFVDGNDMYLTGNLGSTDFPVTENAYDKTFNGPDFRHADAYLTVFNENKLTTSSYLGTSGNEGAFNIFVNNDNNIIIVTQLVKPDDLGIVQDSNSVNDSDASYACVLLFNSTGDSLLSSIQLGFASTLSSVTDTDGYIYVAGSTSDTTFPVTNNAYDTGYNGGVKTYKGDFFITKISPDLDNIVYSTYLGGSGDESYPRIVIDKNKNVILFGSTESDNYPLTQDAFQSLRKGTKDFVITKLSSDGKNILYSSLFGSNENEMESNAEIDINKNGDIYLAGCTDGTDFPVTENAFSKSNNGKTDIIFTILDSTLNTIKYSTYIGGKRDDKLPSLLTYGKSDIIITGTTYSSDFPVTDNCYDNTFNGKSDIFLIKISNKNEITGDYFGQTPPCDSAIIFAPGIISRDDRSELQITFSPTGDECYLYSDGHDGIGIYYTKLENNVWSKQQIAPFSKDSINILPFFSSDGKKLYFTRISSDWSDGNICYVERTDDGWSQPKQLPSPVNSDSKDWSYSETTEGVGYIQSNRNNGDWDVWQINRLSDQSYQVENLGPTVNSSQMDVSPCISPDGSYIIFSSARLGGVSGQDLYISFDNGDNGWTEPVNMEVTGAGINIAGYNQTSPSLSPDGKYLFYCNHAHSGNPIDIYWVSTVIIDSLKSVVTGIQDKDQKSLDKGIKLNQNYPNPFNPSTIISYRIPTSSSVKLRIYNILGQKVKTLVNSFQNAGEYSIVWDATDESNNAVSSGVYFCLLSTDKVNITKKMVLVM
jgi:Tol biopolymer transport system component